MTSGVASSLITIVVLGLWFKNTQRIAVVAAAMLTLIHPHLLMFILIGSIVAVNLKRTRK